MKTVLEWKLFADFAESSKELLPRDILTSRYGTKG
jgi:hypothetical protein